MYLKNNKYICVVFFNKLYKIKVKRRDDVYQNKIIHAIMFASFLYILMRIQNNAPYRVKTENLCILFKKLIFHKKTYFSLIVFSRAFYICFYFSNMTNCSVAART